MNEFIARYNDQISGVITGFDRLVFRGHLALNHESGMKGYLWAKRIAWKDYAQHVSTVSQRVANGPMDIVFRDRRQLRRVRIKHRIGKNSIQFDDKACAEQGAVLRPEVTLNAPGQFRVFHPRTGDEEGPRQWRTPRAGIAGLHRRAEVSQQAQDRNRTALGRVDDTTTLGEPAASIEKRVRRQNRPVRALHPFEAGDLALLQTVNRGEFTIHGLRNRDLQALLYSSAPTTLAQEHRRSAAVTRKLRLLRSRPIAPQCHPLRPTHHYSAAYDPSRKKPPHRAQNSNSSSTFALTGALS